MKRALFLILALMVLAAAGCASATTAPTTAPATTEAAGSTPVPTAETPQYFKKYDPMVTFTQNMVVGQDMKFFEGESIENSPFTQWAEQVCGIKFKAAWISPDWATDNQKMTIAAASNSLPDVMFTGSDVISKFIKADQVMALDDLISQYASPLVKYLNDINVKYTKGKFFQPYIKGGKTFAYPFPYDNPGFWKVNWIRKDILDELGKQVPTTIQEMEDVFAAYMAKYPNGTCIGLDKDLGVDVVMQAFEAYPGMWQPDGNGGLAYGSIQPGIKKGLEQLNKWYNAGYIDKEFVAQTGEQTNATFTKGDTLVYQGAWWNMYWPFPDLWKNSATADMVVLPVLKGPDGKAGTTVSAISGLAACIRKDVQNPEALMYLLNEGMDSMYRPTDYHPNKAILDAMNLAGYQFKYPYTKYQEPTNKDDANRVGYIYQYEAPGLGYFNHSYQDAKIMYGIQLSDPSVLVASTMKVYDDIYNGKVKQDEVNPTVWDGYQALLNTDKRGPSTFVSVYEYWSPFSETDALHVNENVAPPTDAAIAKKALLDTMEKEIFAQIIMGSKPLDAFDKFVSDWNANGGEQWTKEVNEWYASTK